MKNLFLRFNFKPGCGFLAMTGGAIVSFVIAVLFFRFMNRSLLVQSSMLVFGGIFFGLLIYFLLPRLIQDYRRQVITKKQLTPGLIIFLIVSLYLYFLIPIPPLTLPEVDYTLELEASGSNNSSSAGTEIGVLEITKNGQKVPFDVLEQEGEWELLTPPGGLQTMRASGDENAVLRYRFKAASGGELQILFEEGPQSGIINLGINDHRTTIDLYQSDGGMRLESLPLPAPLGQQALLFCARLFFVLIISLAFGLILIGLLYIYSPLQNEIAHWPVWAIILLWAASLIPAVLVILQITGHLAWGDVVLKPEYMELTHAPNGYTYSFSKTGRSYSFSYDLQSQINLYENDEGFGQNLYKINNAEPIGQIGQGRYLLWIGRLYFSTPDNSDPRTNGQQYKIYFPLPLHPAWIVLSYWLALFTSVSMMSYFFRKRALLIKNRPSSHTEIQSRGWDMKFLGFLMILALGVTLFRYREPGSIYPIIGDPWFIYFMGSLPENVMASVFSQQTPKPAWYFLLYLLQPRSAILLPETHTFFTGSTALWASARYVKFMLAGITLWIIPLTGYTSFRLTNSKAVGIVTAILMALSVQQNLYATTMYPYVVQIIPCILFCYRVFYLDLTEGATPRNNWSSGLVSGLLGAMTGMVNYITLLLVLLAFSAAIATRLMRDLDIGAAKFNQKHLINMLYSSLPYAISLMIGLALPYLLLETIFWLGILARIPAFTTAPGFSIIQGYLSQQSYGDTNLALLSGTGLFANISGYLYTMLQTYGLTGVGLLVLAIIWSLFQGIKNREGNNLLIAIPVTVFLGMSLLLLPMLYRVGRNLLPFEFLLFLLLAKMIVDFWQLFFANHRYKIPIALAAIMFCIMLVQMASASFSALESVYGYGRTVRYITESLPEDQPLYLACPMETCDVTSMEDLAALPADTSGHLVFHCVYGLCTDALNDMESFISSHNIEPIKSWPTFRFSAAVITEGRPTPAYYGWHHTHAAIYQIDDILKALNR